MRRYELPERCWRRLEPLLPHPTHHHHAGRPWADHRRVVHGILWRLHTGAPWRDLPERYGPWQTVYERFTRWRADGTWDRLATHLLGDLDRRGKLDRELWCIDATVVRASRSAAGAEKKGAPHPAAAW